MIKINLKQTKQLLELFGGEDASISLSEMPDTEGNKVKLIAWFTEYPDEGIEELESGDE